MNPEEAQVAVIITARKVRLASQTLECLVSRVTGKVGSGAIPRKTIIYFKPTTANFQEPSLCRFKTRTSLSFTLTGPSFADIL
jgi:hypothetical protein